MFHKIKTNIKSILFSNQCKKSLFFMLVSFVIFSFGLDTTFAVGVSDQANLMTDALSVMQYLAGISGAVIGGLTAILSILLDPSWVNGTLFGISSYIKDVWIFVSNVVYLIFAGILIAISFMNIIGKGSGDIFELKKSLPRFIVGVLIVPFSWFIVQFVISMASILTVSVYAWPIETFKERLTNIKGEVEWCDHWIMDIQGSLSSSNNDAEKNDLVYDDVGSSSTSKGFFYCKTGKVQKSIEDILFMKKDGVYNIGGIIGIYSFGIMDVGKLDEFKNANLKDIKNIFQLSAKVVFDVIFVLVYLVILVALFLAMFIRVIVLWIYMMISPVFGLLYFSSKGAGKLGEKFNMKEFLGLAMVPVYVSAALSFGLMFLLIIGEGGKSSSFSANENVASASTQTAEEPYDLGSMKLSIIGSIGDDKNKNSFLSSIAGGALGALGYIMLKLFGLAFLWMAVMAALRSSKITHSVVEPIEKLGDQVGKFAMESPKFIPIPGTSNLSGTGKNMSAGGLFGGIKQGLEMKMRSPSNEATKFAQKFMGTEESRAITNELEKIRQETNPGKQIDLLKDLLVKSDEGNTFLQKSAIADQLALSSNGKVKSETIAAIRDSKNPEKFAEAISNANNELLGELLGEKNTDTKRAQAIMGSGTGTSGTTNVDQSKTENNLNIQNLRLETMAGVTKENGDYKITNAEAFAGQLSSQRKTGQLSQQTDDTLRELLKSKGLVGEDDIKAINDVINKLRELEEKETDESKKLLKDKEDKKTD